MATDGTRRTPLLAVEFRIHGWSGHIAPCDADHPLLSTLILDVWPHVAYSVGYGAVQGVVFALLFAAVSRLTRSVTLLSTWRAGVLGALTSIAIPVALSGPHWSIVLGSGLPALLGASTAVGAVLAARRAPPELSSARKRQFLRG